VENLGAIKYNFLSFPFSFFRQFEAAAAAAAVGKEYTTIVCIPTMRKYSAASIAQ
jgi:hypothetical protein